MNFRAYLAAISVAMAGLLPGQVSAASLPGVTDDYSGTYTVLNGYNGTHGLWFSNLFDGSGLGDSKEWQSTGGSLTYNSGTGDLTVVGTVMNNSNNSLNLSYAFNLTQIADGGRDPACKTGADCQLAPTGSARQLQYDNVLFFDYISASVSGQGVLGGLELSLDLSVPPGLNKPFQFGYCANWCDCNFGA